MSDASMQQPALLRLPGLFFGLFALVTALSLPVWDVLSSYYMHGVIWIVNGSLAILGPAVRLPTSLVRDGVYPGIAGAIALFAVTPRRSWTWKLRWIATLMGGMLIVHAGLLLAQALYAVQGISTEDSVPLRLLGTWGTSVMVIWMWFIALRRKDPEPDA